MPKRKTAARKRATKTKKLDDKANAIADVTPRQVLLMIIEDFEIQGIVHHCMFVYVYSCS